MVLHSSGIQCSAAEYAVRKQGLTGSVPWSPNLERCILAPVLPISVYFLATTIWLAFLSHAITSCYLALEPPTMD